MQDIALAFLRSARVSREDLYGVGRDRQLPRHLVEDARLPLLGFAGPRYAAGGVVLLAINPGGGGDSYKRTPEDEELLPLIEAFRNSSAAEASWRFDAMSSNYRVQMQTWNLWRIFHPVLEACGKELEDVSFLNCFPYRTAGDRMPHAAALRASWTKIIEPLLAELRPSILVALGKKAGGVAARRYCGPAKLYVVPRTAGDSRISEEARVVIETLRRDAI